MDEVPENRHSDEQQEHWEKFYQEHKRPWRGIGSISLDIPTGSKVLDVGCGNGKTTAALINMDMDVTGLDFSPSAISYCISIFGNKAKFSIAECDDMPFADGSFDAVTAVHVLEHLDDVQLKDTISEIKRILVPGGLVFSRTFSADDSRSDGEEKNTRGNGIEYRYYSEEDLKEAFRDFELLRFERNDKTMRYGAVRVRNECLFRRSYDP